MPVHQLDPFSAMISKQGSDYHLHLPRRMYESLENKQLLNKKMRWKIVCEEIN